MVTAHANYGHHVDLRSIHNQRSAIFWRQKSVRVTSHTFRAITSRRVFEVSQFLAPNFANNFLCDGAPFFRTQLILDDTPFLTVCANCSLFDVFVDDERARDCVSHTLAFFWRQKIKYSAC